MFGVPSNLVVPALLALCALSAVVLVRSARGRRLDDHPVCGRCRFDLVGTPARECPECGLSRERPRYGWRRRRTVRRGNRRRRPGLACAAGIAMIASGAGAAAVGLDGWTAWEERKPNWWLVLEARHGSPGRAEAALSALLGRYKRGSADGRTLRDLAVRGLAYQADATRPWLPLWGDAIETAWRDSLLTAAQKQSYVGGALSPALVARGAVRKGDVLPVELALGARVGRSGLLAFEITVKELSIDGVPLGGDGYYAGGTLTCATGMIPAVIPLTAGDQGAWPERDPMNRSAPRVGCSPGDHALRATVSCTVLLPVAGTQNQRVEWGPATPSWYPPGERDYAFIPGSVERTWESTVSVPVRVLEPAAESVVLVSDASLEDVIRQCIKVEIVEDRSLYAALERRTSGSRRGVSGVVPAAGAPPGAWRTAVVTVTDPPIDLAFYGRFTRGRERQECSITATARTTSTFHVDISGLRGEGPLELELRSSVSAAARTVGITRIWNGELRYTVGEQDEGSERAPAR